MLVNDEDRGVKTDSTGTFAFAVDESGEYTFKPVLFDHQFNPPTIRETINEHRVGSEGFTFKDATFRTLSIRARGGSDSDDVPMGTVDVHVMRFGTDPRKFSAYDTVTLSSDSVGLLQYSAPAGRMNIAVTFHPTGHDNCVDTYTRTWDMTRDSTVSIRENELGIDTIPVASTELQRFEFHTPPYLQMDEFWDLCGTKRFIKQYGMYKVRMTARESIPLPAGGYRNCNIRFGKVIIENELTDILTQQRQTTTIVKGTVFSGDSLEVTGYKFLAGEPNIYPNAANPNLSYVKDLKTRIQANGYLTQQHVEPFIITGHKPRTKTFITKTTPMPLLILRHPPGDQSSCTIEKGYTFSRSLQFGVLKENSSGVYADARVGYTLWNDNRGFDAHGTFKRLSGIGDDESKTTTWSFTTTESISTSNANVGQAGGASDVVYGAGFNIRYGKTDVIRIDPVLCTVVSDTDLVMEPIGIRSTYYYTIDHIRTIVIPELTYMSVKKLNSGDTLVALQFEADAEAWTNILRVNDSLKTVADFEDNVSFSAGSSYTRSWTEDTTKSFSVASTMFLSTDATAGFEFKVNNFLGGETGVAYSTRTTFTTTNDYETESQRTVSFSLNDDDPGDYFSVSLKSDKCFRTPVFDLWAGRSSCPWEPGTQPRDGRREPNFAYPKPILEADKYEVIDLLPNDKATFTLFLTNSSESDETRTYLLSVNQLTNIDGAVISVGGVNIENALRFEIPPGLTRKATMTIERGPLAFVYDSLEIILRAECDGNIMDSKFFSAQFISPCSDVTLVEPANNWLINQNDNDIMKVTLTDLDSGRIGADLELQYRRIGTPKWNLARTITRNEILDQKVDQKFEYFTTSWSIPQSVDDGTYEIRVMLRCSSKLDSGIVYSNISTGIINRSALQVFGVPEPRDGILNYGDQISASFSRDIDCGTASSANVELRFTDNNTRCPRGTPSSWSV
ncbi:MAG: hypothetical protein IPP94_13980 [Ignavibacteria bacterium]|nr:hypothetical protein [Ignavibacteria bacterium]